MAQAGLRCARGDLARVTRHEFPGLDHGGSGDRSATNPGGRPGIVAAEVGSFFAGLTPGS